MAVYAQQPAVAVRRDGRDLDDALWYSLDDDDSLNLDYLTAVGRGASKEPDARRKSLIPSPKKKRPLRHSHGAPVFETLEAKSVFSDETLINLIPDSQNRTTRMRRLQTVDIPIC